MMIERRSVFRLLVVLMLAGWCVLSAQTAPQKFDVAAIRANRSGSEGENIDRLDGGRYSVKNASLKTLVLNAYNVLPFQIAGGPRWFDSDRFDIEAKTGKAEKPGRDEAKLLLQNLLLDRFQMHVHWETREMPEYALVTEGKGPKLTVNTQAAEPSMMTPSRGHLNGTGVPMTLLAKNLGNQLSQVVVDNTGLTGAYDFTLEWETRPTPDSTLPSLFTALREQLGLQLKPQKGPVQVLVIDSAQKPSEN